MEIDDKLVLAEPALWRDRRLGPALRVDVFVFESLLELAAPVGGVAIHGGGVVFAARVTTTDTTFRFTNPETNPAANPALTDQAAVDSGGGDHLFFLNHLASVTVSAGESATQMSVVEFTAPRGFGPPLHVHREEDEIMYVIDGEIRLDLRGESQVVTRGAVVSLPHGVPHIFQVLSDEARFLTVTSGATAYPTFDAFVRALGVPTDPTALPAPVEIDPGHVARVCADHGIEVLGPPPAPLA